ncbi:MAG: 50S ribosomal protein L24 [Candidatus Kerfeldbacteria bacterium]|nr:50S ribosomal protein L24 [Candidatus Kerfeldbacteria bacterium]
MNTQLKIKTGDTVKILRGKDAGKTGTVSQVFPSLQKIVVDGVNKTIRHLKSQRRDEKGQRLDFFAPIHISKVALVCPKCSKPTRVAYQLTVGEDGTRQKHRQCKKCNETF